MPLSEKFGPELALIQGERIRDFVREALDSAPAYALTASSSTSGRHHPPDERGEGGMILHWKRVARVAFDLCRMDDMNELGTDCIVAAALLHDIVAQGPGPESMCRTWPEHDAQGVFWLITLGLHNLVPRLAFEQIAGAMVRHSGRWASAMAKSTPWYQNGSMLVHYADYIASRSYVQVEPLS